MSATVSSGRFSAEQQAWFEAASALVNPAELRRIVATMTSIPSPAGDELALAEYASGELRAAGLEATVQRIEDRQANAAARLRGDGSGATLMLYAPIDMHIAGNVRDDGAGVAFEGRPDLLPKAELRGDYVIGLGAENPKGHAACVVAAAQAIARAGIPLRGEIIAALGAGGMPLNASPDRRITRPGVGHGVGCAYLLEHGYRPDFAVIAKPGGAVAYEEVGLCWFELTVRGDFNYAGIPLQPGQRNPLLDAAAVIEKLQDWFPSYTARNTSGLVAPRGSISAVAGGWREKPAFVPAACTISIDLRISPRTHPLEAQRQLDEALEAIRAQIPDLRLDREMLLAIPGTSTPAQNWIVRSSIAAWELIEGREHKLRTGTSGATDANVLRGHGIPTARIGMGALDADAPFAGKFSMGVVSVAAMERLTRALIAVAVDTCTRPRKETA